MSWSNGKYPLGKIAYLAPMGGYSYEKIISMLHIFEILSKSTSFEYLSTLKSPIS